MPSNKQYKEQAEQLAAELEVEITTDGLNNEQLGDLVSDLKAKARDAELDTQADDAPEETQEPAGKRPPHSVASGKSITSRRGILAPGDEIKAEDLSGGKESLDKFVKSGHVVKA
jgi:hypothetical protein